MRKILVTAAVVFIAVVAAYFLLPQNNGTGIEVGAILPVTGPVASIGKPTLQGAQLAAEEFNNGRPSNEQIEIIVQDTQAKPEIAITAYQQLVSTGHPVAVVGPLTSGESIALLSHLQKGGVPVVSPGASSASLDGLKDLFYRVELSDSVGGAVEANLAFDKLGSRNIAVLYLSNEYGKGLEKVFSDQFRRRGGRIAISVPFSPNETEFHPILARIKQSGVDTLFMVGIDELVTIVDQARDVGFGARLLTTPIFENKAYLDQLGAKAEGVYYVYYGSFDIAGAGALTRNFIARYRDRFHQQPTYYSALGFDSVRVISNAIEISKGAPSAKTIASAFNNGISFDGVTGSARLNSFGDVIKPVTLKQVINGKFTILGLTPSESR